MSTQAPARAYSGLYRGRDAKGFGEALREMASSGRDVSSEERPRWTENRAMYLGDQWLAVNPSNGQVRTLARTGQLRSRRRRDTVNRLRPFTDGRLALYATEKPPFEVEPPDRDQDSIDGARQAEAFIEAQWGGNAWDIKATFPELARAGEIDGLAFLYVNWNPRLGPSGNLPIPYDRLTAQPIDDRATLEALQQMDPEAQTLWEWRHSPQPLGDVEFRIVRAGALSIDPFATSNFKDARWVVESRALPRDQVEQIARRPIRDILGESSLTMQEQGLDSLPEVNTDDGDGRTRGKRVRDSVVIHEAYRKPGGDWPKGAHCIWLDKAPGSPIIAEPWEDDLPYRPFMPKPHGGHFLASRGTVDDLKPVQIKLNRTYSALGDWMDKMGNPPLLAAKGAMISQQVYGSPGDLVEYHQGFEKPEFFRTPSEPAVTMQQYIVQLETEMAEIANLPAASRGLAPGGGVESNVAIVSLQQTTEQQLSGSSAELVRMYEWAISRALVLVGKHYTVPRLISTPGVSDAEEFAAFTGQMLHGASRFRVTGSLQPKSRAAEMQGLMAFAPILGESIKPYVGRLIHGDTSGLTESLEMDAQRQKRKNRKIAAVATDERAKTVWRNFQQDKQTFAQLMNAIASGATAMATQVPGMPINPMELAAARGITPPRLTDAMKQAGIDVPVVDWQDDPIVQLETLRRWALSDGYEKLPEMVRQIAREMHEDLVGKTAQQLTAMTAQQPPMAGSDPAEKGAPSPPKQPGTPAGAPPPKMPGG